MCSLMINNEFTYSSFIIENTNSKLKKIIFNKIHNSLEKPIEKNIHQCIKNDGCIYKGECIKHFRKLVKKLVKQEIKNVSNHSDRNEK